MSIFLLYSELFHILRLTFISHITLLLCNKILSSFNWRNTVLATSTTIILCATYYVETTKHVNKLVTTLNSDILARVVTCLSTQLYVNLITQLHDAPAFWDNLKCNAVWCHLGFTVTHVRLNRLEHFHGFLLYQLVSCTYHRLADHVLYHFTVITHHSSRLHWVLYYQHVKYHLQQFSKDHSLAPSLA